MNWLRNCKTYPACNALLTACTHAIFNSSISCFVIAITGAWFSFHDIALGPYTRSGHPLTAFDATAPDESHGATVEALRPACAS